MYQAASRPLAAPSDTVAVVLVIDVPGSPGELPERAARLADDYGRLIADSVPGARVRAATLTTSPVSRPEPFRGLVVDLIDRRIRIDGRTVHLAYREFELINYLAARPGRVVSRAELIAEVWYDRAPGVALNHSHRTVDTHVRRLRAKLGPYARVLTTVRGRGYRYDSRDAPVAVASA